jgi:hypothetical protein
MICFAYDYMLFCMSDSINWLAFEIVFSCFLFVFYKAITLYFFHFFVCCTCIFLFFAFLHLSLFLLVDFFVCTSLV